MAQPLPHFVDYQQCNVFLTISVAPHMYNMTSREIYKQTKSKMEEALRRHCKLYFCVMELTKNGIPHYHCILRYKDDDIDPIAILDTLKSYKTKPFGNTCSKPITDLVELCDYMVKDLRNTKTHRIINNGKKSILPIYFSSKDTKAKPSFNLKDCMDNSMRYNGNSCNLDSGLELFDDDEIIDTEINELNNIFINVKK